MLKLFVDLIEKRPSIGRWIWQRSSQRLAGYGDNITQSVLQAMRAEHDRKRRLIQQYIPGCLRRVFHQFARLRDSTIFDSFKDGSLVYTRFVLQKP